MLGTKERSVQRQYFEGVNMAEHAVKIELQLIISGEGQIEVKVGNVGVHVFERVNLHNAFPGSQSYSAGELPLTSLVRVGQTDRGTVHYYGEVSRAALRGLRVCLSPDGEDVEGCASWKVVTYPTPPETE